jgi:hypothetical protein
MTQYKEIDWLAILGGRKAKILAFLLLALKVYVFWSFSPNEYSYLRWKNPFAMLVLGFCNLYIMFESVRELFKVEPDRNMRTLYLSLCWFFIIGDVILMAISFGLHM